MKMLNSNGNDVGTLNCDFSNVRIGDIVKNGNKMLRVKARVWNASSGNITHLLVEEMDNAYDLFR